MRSTPRSALADAGADLNVQDPDGTPALTVAVVNGHHDVAQMLIERGANPNVADTVGMTPLYAAVELHTSEMYPERRPLRQSYGSATLDLIKLLLAKGAAPDSPLKAVTLRWGRRRGPGDAALAEGTTPLMRAARFADVDVMRTLLDGGRESGTEAEGSDDGADAGGRRGMANRRNDPRRLDFGPESDAIEAVKLCLERGGDVDGD